MATWYHSKNPGSHVAGKLFSIDEPSVTIMAQGMGNDAIAQWRVAQDGRPDPMIPIERRHGRAGKLLDEGKPPYRVPLVSEVNDIEWNGFTVASTFAGAGGSSFGYRMAGFRVLWANEFVPIAQESYRANMRAGTIMDGRDVKIITAADILAATGLSVGELDIFDGSPPCQAFSTAGKREKGWGTERSYEHGASQKNEDLFDEYIRLRDGLMPRVFIAENVSGLVKGVAKGYFLDILKRLKVGYRVEARVLDAQWLGVPQQRSRVIFIGVRDDLALDPVFPKPFPFRYTVRDAIPWITRPVTTRESGFGTGSLRMDAPSPAVTASKQGLWSATQVEVDLVARNGRNFKRKRRSIDEPASTIVANAKQAELTIEQRVMHDPGRGKKRDITDEPSPTVTAGPTDTSEGGGPRNHFKVQDGVERRRFTIEEIKRICSFPDDFVLAGRYAQQWERLGNSVPPVMMFQIAKAVRDGVLRPAREADKSKAKPRASDKRHAANPPASAALASRA
jgi:DNA (cytosine-5)-methyltransferase 1